MNIDDIDVRKDNKAQLIFRKIYKKSGSIGTPPTLEWDQLHEARRKLTDESEDLLNRAIDDKRSFDENEELAFAVAKDLLDWVGEEFDRREKENDRGPFKPRKMYFPDTRKPTTENRLSTTSRSFRGLFHGAEDAPLDRGGFESFNDFLYTIAAGRADARLLDCEKRTQTIGTGSEGGFAAPDEFGGWLLDESLAQEIVRQQARTLQCNPIPRTMLHGITRIRRTQFMAAFRGSGHLKAAKQQLRRLRLASSVYTHIS